MCVFVWVKSIMLIIVISEWSNYEWKKKSGCFCLHCPRCWMVRYQQLALRMLVLTKSRQAETCLSSSEFYSCVVFTSLLWEQTHLWMISWVLPPIICAIYLAFCQHVVPKSFFFFESLGVVSIASSPPSPSAPCHHVCHLSVREEFWHCPDEPTDSWEVVSNFSSPSGFASMFCGTKTCVCSF